VPEGARPDISVTAPGQLAWIFGSFIQFMLIVAVLMISYGTPFFVPLGAFVGLIAVVVVIRRRTGGPSAS